MVLVKKWFVSALVMGGVWSSAGVLAQTVKVDEPWVRGTVAQQKATGAFMRLTADKNARLVAIHSPVAGVAEIHEMAMEKEVMRMRQVSGVDLPAGRATELKPGGYHVMLMDLKQALKAGDAVPLTLVFEDDTKKRFTQEIQAPIKALSGGAMPAQHGHDHGDMKH